MSIMEGSSEGSQISPQLHAIESMVPQLDYSDIEKADSAVQNIATAAFHSDDIKTKLRALDVLGEYAGTQKTDFIQVAILNSQDKARQRMLAIGLTENNPELQAAAIKNLARGLKVDDSENNNGIYHRMIVQNIAILASASENADVKKSAITYLSEYAQVKSDDESLESENYSWKDQEGYLHAVVPSIQRLANDAIGAITASGPKKNNLKI